MFIMLHTQLFSLLWDNFPLFQIIILKTQKIDTLNFFFILIAADKLIFYWNVFLD